MLGFSDLEKKSAYITYTRYFGLPFFNQMIFSFPYFQTVENTGYILDKMALIASEQ